MHHIYYYVNYLYRVPERYNALPQLAGVKIKQFSHICLNPKVDNYIATSGDCFRQINVHLVVQTHFSRKRLPDMTKVYLF